MTDADLRLTVSALAERDLTAAAEWYDRRVPGLGDVFLGQVEECLDLIAHRPEMFQPLFGAVRRAIVSHFPYQVVYRRLPSEVQVLAVLHCRIDPATASRRSDE